VLTGGGPALTNSEGFPWTGAYINANGDPTVDLRSNIGAESRAKIVYEYLLQFTDDPMVHESLRFLMTREISHFQMFSAALEEIEPNFPPGILQGDPRYTHTYFNLSNGPNVRGPWNTGQGPWNPGEEWTYVEDPVSHVRETGGLVEEPVTGKSPGEAKKMEAKLAKERSGHMKSAVPAPAPLEWSTYPETAPMSDGGDGASSTRKMNRKPTAPRG
jgi:Mn-containing catalase